MFSSTATSLKTVKSSLQTAESFRKCFCFPDDIRNGGCRHQLSTEKLMCKTVRAPKQNSKRQNEIFTEPTLVRKYVLAKVLTTERSKLGSDVCIQKHNSRNPIEIDPNFPLIREFFGNISL